MWSWRKNILWFLLIVLSAAVQATWFEAIRYGGAVPDLVLLLVVYFALSDGEERGMFTGALGGVFQDVAADTVLGHHVLGNVIIGYAVGHVSHRLIAEHPAVKVGVVFMSALAHGVLFHLVSYVQDPGLGIIRNFVGNVVPGAFYTAIVTPVVFIALDGLRRKKGPTPGGVMTHDG